MHNTDQHPWKVLLVGGSSGVGKTWVSRQLAKHLSVSLLLVDDVRIALQQATTRETNPDLHLFLDYSPQQWQDPEAIIAGWKTVGEALVKPLNAIVAHHLAVPEAGALILEGDGILPVESNPIFQHDQVASVYIVEQDESQLLCNLRSRTRGFHQWGEVEQESFAHASWRYGQWLAGQASALGLPVIAAGPQGDLFERLLSIVI